MAKSKGFELIPQAIPARQRSGFYREILTEFMDSGEESAAIVGTNRKPVTLVQGLRKVLETEDIVGVRVIQRSQGVYLARV